MPSNQDWLIKRMQKCNYDCDEQGVCQGVSYMGMQAILVRDTSTFDKRFQIINKIPLDTFKTDLEKLLSYFNKFNVVNEKALITKEIPPLFEGIQLYDNGYLYDEIVNTNEKLSTQVSKLVNPSGSNPKIKLAEEFSGVYTQSKLVEYLMLIRDFFSGYQAPIALVLKNHDHAITIGLDKEWSLIDVNLLPEGESPTKFFSLTNLSAIASLILNCLAAPRHFEKGSAFTTEIFVSYPNKIQKNVFQTKLRALKDSDSWKKLHSFNFENANLIDDEGSSWIKVAIQDKHLEEVKNLLEYTNAKTLNNITLDGSTFPLYTAVEARHTEILKLLLSKDGIDVNLTIRFKGMEGFTALHRAIEMGYIEGVSELLKHPLINPNLPASSGLTPLFLAIKEENNAMVKELLNHKAILPDLDVNGMTPILFASLKANKSIYDQLIKCKGNESNLTNKITFSSESLKKFAASNEGDKHKIEKLINAFAKKNSITISPSAIWKFWSKLDAQEINSKLEASDINKNRKRPSIFPSPPSKKQQIEKNENDRMVIARNKT